MLYVKEPIVAIATAPGRGAVGIVRVSGFGLGGFIRRLVGRELKPRHAHYGPFLDAQGQAIDHGLALHFPAPHSYTGEEVLELQAHGGPIVLQLLLARCMEVARETGEDGRPLLPALRLAQPGEFTQRAFFNDKMDLAQAEAVSDLIDASTEAAARSAGRSLSGAFSKEIGVLRDQLVQLRMLVEATLDFPEEEIDFLEKADAFNRIRRIQQQLGEVTRQARQGQLLREGMSVVLCGQPNVGKSSLLNALAGAELAIVTPIAGTTRDKVAETIQIEGVPLHVIDTAGLRAAEEASDDIERIGIERSWAAIRDADAVLFLHDLTRLGDAAYDSADQAIFARLPQGPVLLHVDNKVDEGATDRQNPWQGEHIAVSAKTGQGLEALRAKLLAIAGWQSTSEGVFIARERHLQALRRTLEHVDLADEHAHSPMPALELLAEELRLAHDALGEITGAFTADDLLGEIFSRFCIGK